MLDLLVFQGMLGAGASVVAVDDAVVGCNECGSNRFAAHGAQAKDRLYSTIPLMLEVSEDEEKDDGKERRV